MVRAGENAFLIEDFQNKYIVVIGHNYLGNLTNVNSKEEIRGRLREYRPQFGERQIGIRVRKISYFLFDMNLHEWVITYNPKTREYLIGIIKSKYEHNSDLCKYHNIRRVKWSHFVKRDNLSEPSQKHLSYRRAVFPIDKQVADEIINLMELL